jgi:hypothetical protein
MTKITMKTIADDTIAAIITPLFVESRVFDEKEEVLDVLEGIVMTDAKVVDENVVRVLVVEVVVVEVVVVLVVVVEVVVVEVVVVEVVVVEVVVVEVVVVEVVVVEVVVVEVVVVEVVVVEVVVVEVVVVLVVVVEVVVVEVVVVEVVVVEVVVVEVVVVEVVVVEVVVVEVVVVEVVVIAVGNPSSAIYAYKGQSSALRMISTTKFIPPVLQLTLISPSVLASARQFCPAPPLGSPYVHGRKGTLCPALGPSVSTQLPSLLVSEPDTYALRARNTHDRYRYSSTESMVAR